MLEKLLRWELQLEWHNVILAQECTNPGRQVAAWSTICTVAPKICGSSVWNLLLVTLLVRRILKWLLDYYKICALLH